MTPDPLDDLLDRSAPRTVAVRDDDLRAMVRDARREQRMPRRRRIGMVSGVLALLLIGGAGVATASSPWLWGAGMNPNRSYAYTSPTWGACELRHGDYVAANPFHQFEIDRIIDEWFATADISAEVEPLIDKYLDVLEDSQAREPEPITDPRLPDLNYWTAVEQAVGEALHEELQRNGFDTGSVTGSSSQVHCEGEVWQ